MVSRGALEVRERERERDGRMFFQHSTSKVGFRVRWKSAVKVSLATVKNPARKFPEKSAVKVFMKSSIAQVEL